MDSSLKDFVRFEGKIFWVDLETPSIRIINPDGTSREALSTDANLMDLLNEATIVPQPSNYNPRSK